MDRETKSAADSSMSELCARYKELQQKLKDTNNLTSLEERKQVIMNLLHKFNDVKDAAQIVIGALANMEDKTIKEMHIHYKLPTNE